MTDPSTRQVGGTHYQDMAVQPWDALESWLTPEGFRGYLLGTAIAYLARVNASGSGKGGRQDVEKAMHTLERFMACEIPTPMAESQRVSLRKLAERLRRREASELTASRVVSTEDVDLAAGLIEKIAR